MRYTAVLVLVTLLFRFISTNVDSSSNSYECSTIQAKFQDGDQTCWNRQRGRNQNINGPQGNNKTDLKHMIQINIHILLSLWLLLLLYSILIW
jgi:hypothetical protein